MLFDKFEGAHQVARFRIGDFIQRARRGFRHDTAFIGRVTVGGHDGRRTKRSRRAQDRADIVRIRNLIQHDDTAVGIYGDALQNILKVVLESMGEHRNALVHGAFAHQLVDVAPRCGLHLAQGARGDRAVGVQFGERFGCRDHPQNLAVGIGQHGGYGMVAVNPAFA